MIRPGSVSNNLIQTTDFVPTFFDVANAKTPKSYHIDGTTLKPIFTDPAAKVHDHLYFELGYARAVRTQHWKYIAIRYSAERFSQIKGARLLKLPGALAYAGGVKNAANHLRRRSHYLASDQLYRLSSDPLEKQNLARNPEFKKQLEKLRKILSSELKLQKRPFGEFVPGDDSVPQTKIQPYLDRLKQLRPIRRGFEKTDGTQTAPETKLKSRSSREKRRKARLKKKQARQKARRKTRDQPKTPPCENSAGICLARPLPGLP